MEYLTLTRCPVLTKRAVKVIALWTVRACRHRWDGVSVGHRQREADRQTDVRSKQPDVIIINKQQLTTDWARLIEWEADMVYGSRAVSTDLAERQEVNSFLQTFKQISTLRTFFTSLFEWHYFIMTHNSSAAFQNSLSFIWISAVSKGRKSGRSIINIPVGGRNRNLCPKKS